MQTDAELLNIEVHCNCNTRVIFCSILTCTFLLIFNSQIELVSAIIKSLDVNVWIMKTVD